MSTTSLTFLAAGLALLSALFANHVNNTCYSSDLENQRRCPIPFLLAKPIPSEIEIKRLREEKARLDAEKNTMRDQMAVLQETISELKQGENEKTLLRQQVETMQRQLSQSQQTEAERAALRQQVATLEQKLSEMHVPPPPLPKPPSVKTSVISLPLTKDGKVDFEMIFSPPPPVRDEFETKEEFATRLRAFEQYQVQLVETLNQAAAQHDLRVQAGTAQLERKNYNVDKAEFVVQLTWAAWVEQRFILDEMARISVGRDMAKGLFDEGQQKPVFVTLQISGDQKTVASSFLAGLGKGINLLMAAPQVFVARDRLKDGSFGPEMVWIPAGTFQMGSNDGYDSEEPVHTVTVKSFAMGKYEVTFEEYDKFCDATGRSKPSDSGWGRGKRPVIYVNWDDAKAYVKWLSEQTGKDYRLPSEAQWEYACRAGSVGKYSFGDDVNQLGNYGWYDKNSGSQTHPVGEKQANKFGLYDMHGNVWEWLEDKWHDSYSGAPADGSAWMSGDSNTRLLRGDSWGDDGNYLRCADRSWNGATGRYNYRGFRISRM